MTQTHKGRRIWKLSAPKAAISRQGQALLERPKVLFYRDNKHTSTALAREAVVQAGSQDIALKGDVVITGREERVTLRTARLDYSDRDGRFHTKETVLLDRPGARLRGRGLDADRSLSKITIYHQETVLQHKAAAQ